MGTRFRFRTTGTVSRARICLIAAIAAMASGGGLRAGDREFRFDSSVARVQLWGVPVPQFRRVFWGEELPALFDRALVLESADLAGGTLNWIFTGNCGGFTIEVTSDQLRVTQRYYDSFGFWKRTLDSEPLRTRHPEQVTSEAAVPCPASLRELRVRLDHQMQLSVGVNGAELVRQPCLFDVSRHQLAFTVSSDEVGSVRGRLAAPETNDSSVRVHSARRRQTMLGFGGITSPVAFHELSAEGKRRWWELLAEYNLRLHREYPMGAQLDAEFSNWDRLADALPTYYGDNFPNGQVSDFEYLRKIRALGGMVLFEFWDLPLAARCERTNASGEIQRDVAEPETFARAVVRYCEVSRDRTGSPPEIVGIQNEKLQPPEVWHAMTLALRRGLDRAGFPHVRIHMQDASTLESGIQSALQFQQSEAAWSAIDYSATHVYDYQQFLFEPDGFDVLLRQWHDTTGDKPFLSTELCVNRDPYQIASYRLALGMGQLYHKNLVLTDAVALIYCFLLVNVEQPSYGWTRSLFVADHARESVPVAASYQLRVFGAFSRRIRRGMVRVETETSDPDLMVTAFEGDGQERTLVMLNRSLRPQRVRVFWPSGSFGSLELVDPYHENSVQPAPPSRADGETEVEIAPGAIATLSNVSLGIP
jgi:hypothetical protein